MKYCKTTTENHAVSISIPHCLEDINDKILREDRANTIVLPFFKNREKVIDLDVAEMEKSLSEGRWRNKSMDMAFGVTAADNVEKSMVMVELKLNHIGLRNLKETEIEEKIRGSLKVLADSVPIYFEYYFIFSSDLVEQAKAKLFRFYTEPELRRSRKAETMEGLKVAFFD